MEHETPDIAAMKALFAQVDAVVNEHCPTPEDQIGLLLTCILTRVAQMAHETDVNPKREVERISSALKREWRLFQQLLDTQRPSGSRAH